VRLLEVAPRLSLPSCNVVVVSPHPDDEVLGAGGLIHSAARAGRQVTVLSVTDGEAAYTDWDGLGRIRRRELSDALGVLAAEGVSLHRLSIPDGQVDRHRAALFDAIDRRLSTATLLGAPYEHDGHPDHDATGEVCCEVARLRGLTLWRFPIWTWHHGDPAQFATKRWGRFALDAAACGAKTQALSCFASQMHPLGRAPIVPRHVLPYFTRSDEMSGCLRNSRDVGPRFHSMSVQHFTRCRPGISRHVGPGFHGMSVQFVR
jgi:LmbE family N-acetylglucosaminyl deacetylase